MRARLYDANGALLGECELKDRPGRRPLGPAEKLTVVLDEPVRRDRDSRPLFLEGRLSPVL